MEEWREVELVCDQFCSAMLSCRTVGCRYKSHEMLCQWIPEIQQIAFELTYSNSSSCQFLASNFIWSIDGFVYPDLRSQPFWIVSKRVPKWYNSSLHWNDWKVTRSLECCVWIVFQSPECIINLSWMLRHGYYRAKHWISTHCISWYAL